jgi:hypothetical protein
MNFKSEYIKNEIKQATAIVEDDNVYKQDS